LVISTTIFYRKLNGKKLNMFRKCQYCYFCAFVEVKNLDNTFFLPILLLSVVISISSSR